MAALITSHVRRPPMNGKTRALGPRMERPCDLGEVQPVSAVDWSRYRKCPSCHAELGKPCRTLSGAVVGGRSPDAAEVDRDRPHSRRQLRVGYGHG